jgi:molybdenum cofactor cytidylyltransferase
MGRFKLTLPWGGSTVIGQVVATLETAGLHEIFAVTGHRAEEVAAVLADTAAATVFNPDYATGEMLSSIQVGLRALGSGVSMTGQAALLCLSDQPQMEVAAVCAVLTAGQAIGWGRIVVPSYQMRAGHPILLPKAIWPTRSASICKEDALPTSRPSRRATH